MHTIYKNLTLSCFCFFIALFGVSQYARAASQADLETYWQQEEQYRLALVEKMKESTLLIGVTYHSEGTRSHGTGFVVAPGYAITNRHVVDDDVKTIHVYGKDFKKIRASIVKINKDDELDFALLKFDDASIPPLTFTTTYQRIEAVSAWGFPYSTTQLDKNFKALLSRGENVIVPITASFGKISFFADNVRGTFIEHTAKIADGSSGGPLINHDGYVIGVNTMARHQGRNAAMTALSLHAKDAIAFIRSAGVEPQIK